MPSYSANFHGIAGGQHPIPAEIAVTEMTLRPFHSDDPEKVSLVSSLQSAGRRKCGIETCKFSVVCSRAFIKPNKPSESPDEHTATDPVPQLGIQASCDKHDTCHIQVNEVGKRVRQIVNICVDSLERICQLQLNTAAQIEVLTATASSEQEVIRSVARIMTEDVVGSIS